MRMFLRSACGTVAVSALILASAVEGRQAKPPAQMCAALADIRIGADKIGPATKGAVIASSTLVPAVSQAEASAARPEYCEVMGQILPVDPAAPPIRFQVNLPTDWNGKALHMGGGGWDGTAVTGLGGTPRSPATAAPAIARGYATFGGDGGHEGNDSGWRLGALTSLASQAAAARGFAWRSSFRSITTAWP